MTSRDVETPEMSNLGFPLTDYETSKLPNDYIVNPPDLTINTIPNIKSSL